jgi:steroid delta-isomerase-like uncharacterized protein
MTNQDTKQIAIAQLDRISSGDIAGAAAMMADDYVNHAALPDAQGRKGFVMILEKLRTAFPDMHHTLEDAFADGDRVVLRVTVTGTHTGPFAFTRLTLPATGKPVKYEQIHILRIVNGKIAESWMALDHLAFFRQLGVQIAPPA